MNPAFVYCRNSRSIFWLAFFFALAIHLGAVALAKTKSPTNKLQDVSPLPDVEVVDTVEPALLEESGPPSPLEQIHPDQDSFQEKNLMPPPIRAHRKARPLSFIGGTPASLRSVKATVAYAPRPVYPYQARRLRLTGSGVALLTVDQTSGTVTDVRMAQSCGNVILDNSTVDAFRRWRFKPGGVTQVEVPITYTLIVVSY
jgi:TonB family protein